MKTTKFFLGVAIGLAAAAILQLATPRAAAAEGGFVILVNKQNDVTSMTRSELKRAATGGIKQWKNGSVVQLGVIASEAPETAHLASLLELAPRELLNRIQEQVFKGEMRRPVVLRSSADCAAFARSNPGAVCVASAATPVPPEVHVVAIH